MIAILKEFLLKSSIVTTKDKSQIKKSKGRQATHQSSLKGKVAAAAIRFAGSFSLEWGQRLGSIIGRVLYLSNNREVKIARTNLENCFPGLSEGESDTFLKKAFAYSGMLAFEVAHLWCASPTQSLQYVKSVDGQDVLEHAQKLGKGVVIILPHLGNWEMVNAYLMQHMQLCAMYSPAQLYEVDQLMKEGRSKTGLLLAEANSQGVVKLIKILKKGGNLIILPDQEPIKDSGEFAPFFSKEAYTMTLITKMLQKSGATPVLAYVKRLGIGQGFELRFRKLEEGMLSTDMRESLTAMNASVEKAVRESPEEYMWGYKRFRKRPAGEKPFYK